MTIRTHIYSKYLIFLINKTLLNIWLPMGPPKRRFINVTECSTGIDKLVNRKGELKNVVWLTEKGARSRIQEAIRCLITSTT